LSDLFNLTGKTVLITGASSGLGRQMVKTLAGAGAGIIAVARNKQRLEDISKHVDEIGSHIRTYSIDLNNSDEIRGFINNLGHEKIVVDVLINNAGISKKTPVDNDYLELWEQQINVNLKAVWQLSQGIAQQMIANKTPGSIINISSINGASSPYTDAAAYGSTKAAVIQLSKVLSGTLARHNIRVNTIVPGLFYTELTAENIDSVAGTDNDISKQIPLNFIAEPKDLDGLILYLASNNASRYVTGAEFVIDGGISANCKGI